MHRWVLLSIIAGLIGAVFGFTTTSRSGDPSAKIKEVEQKMAKVFEPRPVKLSGDLGKKFTNVVVTCPGWNEVKPIGDDLNWQNANIFKAKAFTHYDEVPDAEKYSAYWDDRYQYASKPWVIQEDGAYFYERVKNGLLAGIGSAVSMFIAIWLLVISWRFLLERIRELSRAVKGE